MLCSFAVDRTAQIKIEQHMGPRFQLLAGVPQGSILSPTLFIFYTHDIPPPTSETDLDVVFADDVTQVLCYKGPDREQIAIQTEQEIVRINKFEKTWKIKINANKFKMITISKTHPWPVSVNDQNMPFAQGANILGLKITRTGCSSHVTAKINAAKFQLLKLRRRLA